MGQPFIILGSGALESANYLSYEYDPATQLYMQPMSLFFTLRYASVCKDPKSMSVNLCLCLYVFFNQ